MKNTLSRKHYHKSRDHCKIHLRGSEQEVESSIVLSNLFLTVFCHVVQHFTFSDTKTRPVSRQFKKSEQWGLSFKTTFWPNSWEKKETFNCLSRQRDFHLDIFFFRQVSSHVLETHDELLVSKFNVLWMIAGEANRFTLLRISFLTLWAEESDKTGNSHVLNRWTERKSPPRPTCAGQSAEQQRQ